MLWVLGILQSVVKLVGWGVAGFSFISRVVESITNFIANNKLFLTILFLGISIAIYHFIENKLDDILALVTGIDSPYDVIDYSLLNKFCDASLLFTFGKNIVSGLVTYYTVFSTGLGFSVLSKLHASGTRSIKI